MRPKLILTDLDGTLLREDKTLSPINRAALEQAAAQGAEVVVATGRFYGGIPQELRDLPFLRYFILMNGAKVYDRKEDKVLYRAEIPLATAEQIFDDMESIDATVDCFQNDDGYMDGRYLDNLEHYIRDPESIRLVRLTRRRCEDFRATVRAAGSDIQKMQFYFPDLQERARVKAWLEERYPEAVLSISMPENLELNDARATKGQGLLALCEALGLDPDGRLWRRHQRHLHAENRRRGGGHGQRRPGDQGGRRPCHRRQPAGRSGSGAEPVVFLSKQPGGISLRAVFLSPSQD